VQLVLAVAHKQLERHVLRRGQHAGVARVQVIDLAANRGRDRGARSHHRVLHVQAVLEKDALFHAHDER
jgi:hypothetical protein